MAEAVPALVSTMFSPGELTRRSEASDHSGVLEGQSPTKYMPSNPVLLFIVQVSSLEKKGPDMHWSGSPGPCCDSCPSTVYHHDVALGTQMDG